MRLEALRKSIRALVPDRLADGVRELIQRTTDVKAAYWKVQDLESVKAYWSTRGNEASAYLVKLLEGYPFESLLEIGCNCGNRLYSIAKRFPGARLAGIDINPLAVGKGMEWLREEGIRNVELRVLRAEELSTLAADSYDLVFSWATLIYVRPKEIERVLREVCRVARSAVVLIEMQSGYEKADPLGVYYPPGNWKRDYVHLLRGACPSVSGIKVTGVPKGIWNPSGGGASVVSVRKEQS